MSWSWLLTNVAASCLLPPLNGLLLAGGGFWVRRRSPRLGRGLMLAGFVLIFLLSLQVVARQLLKPLEQRYPPLELATLDRFAVDAVVVLGGGRVSEAPQFSGAGDVTPQTLERLRYAAFLAKTLKKPLLVSGGNPEGGRGSEAEAMRLVLQRDFDVAVRWVEAASGNTFENARNAARILGTAGDRRIVLVTHAWHMPRAVQAFERAGMRVVPAPAAYLSNDPLLPLDFLPRAGSLGKASLALHEWLGLAWYALW